MLSSPGNVLHQVSVKNSGNVREFPGVPLKQFWIMGMLRVVLGAAIDSTGISACSVSIVQPVGGTRGKQMCFMYKCSAFS